MKYAICQKALLACLCLGFLAVPASASTYYLPQIAVGAVGDLQVRTLVTLSNPSSNTSSNTTIAFATHNDDGSEWIIDWEARDRPDLSGPQGWFSWALGPGDTVTMLAKSTGPLKIGWMGGRSTHPIVLTVRYSVAQVAGGVIDPQWEVGVLPAAGLNEHFLFVAEGASDWNNCITSTALAIGNTAFEPATVTLELFGYQGSTPLRTQTISLPANGHLARFLPEIFTDVFSAAAFRGMLRISSNTAVAVTTLQNWVAGPDSVYASASTLPFQAAASNVCFDTEPTELSMQGEIIALPAELVGVLNSSSDGPDTDVFRLYVTVPATLGIVSLADITGSELAPQIGLYTEGGQLVVANGAGVLPAFGASAFQAAIAQTGWYSLRVSSPSSAHGRRQFYRVFVGRK